MTTDTPAVAVAPHKNPYGKIIRERGTLRIFLSAILLGLAYYAYSTIHISQMNQKQWPLLTPDSSGLTVVGLRDVDKPGWKRKYVAIESNHSWRIRRPDDDESKQEDSGDSGERGADPSATHKVAKGEVVTVEEVLKECPAVLNVDQFTDASVEERRENAPPPFDRSYWVIHLGLTGEGQSRFWQFSSEHEGERLAFILDKEIITCTKMDNPPPPFLAVFVRSLDVQPIWVKTDAERLAQFINSHRR